MKRRVPWCIGLCLLAAACQPQILALTPDPVLPSTAEVERSSLGTYDSIQLPLETIPEPDSADIFHPPFLDPSSGAHVQVLRVIRDPRPIPVDRWLFANPTGQRAIAHPSIHEIRARIDDGELYPIAVYVRVRSPNDERITDPFFPTTSLSGDVRDAWPPLEVVDGVGLEALPCASLAYVFNQEPYLKPDQAELFDPRLYPPPQPRYEPKAQALLPGENREGWLLCPSPEADLNALWLTWENGSRGSNGGERLTAWRALARLQLGDWHLIPEATVVGWDEPDGEGPIDSTDDPLLPGATPDGGNPAIPSRALERVYRGPVAISVGIGISDMDGAAGPLGSGFGPNQYLPSTIPEDCEGVRAQFTHQEPWSIPCLPWEEKRYSRISMQIHFPGMEHLREEWDHLALADPVSVEVYLDEAIDGLIATFEGIHVFTEATWLWSPIPDGADTLWATVETTGGPAAGSPLPVWRVDLHEYESDSTQVSELCRFAECMNPGELSLAPPDRHRLEITDAIPIIPQGMTAAGIKILDTWTTAEVVLLNDNLHGADFIPTRRSDPWLLIEIAANTQRAGDLYLLYPADDGGLAMEPMDLAALYRGDEGAIALRYGVRAQLRPALQGIALVGTLPKGVSLDDTLLILPNSGPAWRLTSAGKPQPIGETPSATLAAPGQVPTPLGTGPQEMDLPERMSQAFPGFGEGRMDGMGGMQGEDWPDLLYPGDSSQIAGKSFSVNQMKIIPGEGYPTVYEPATGNIRPAPDGLRANLLAFNQNTEVFIPPNASLVMVQLYVDPEAVEMPAGRAGCRTPGERDYGDLLRLSYPGYGEVPPLRTSSDENFGGYASPTLYCLSSGWLYFHIGTLDIDTELLWFEIVDDVEDEVVIWSLSSTP